MLSQRRIGKKGSETRMALLEAAEQLMRTEGYAAVTSRRLAAYAELKPQLVHYYFRTMDELFEELYRKVANQYLGALEELKERNDGLVQLWELSCNTGNAVLLIEFLALANHQPSLRELMQEYAAAYQEIQVQIIEKAMVASGIDTAEWSPGAIAVIMDNLPRILAIRDEFGIKPGFDEARQLVMRLLEPLISPPVGASPARRPIGRRKAAASR
jgi:TetR/AcrR family transcriptional regulator